MDCVKVNYKKGDTVQIMDRHGRFLWGKIINVNIEEFSKTFEYDIRVNKQIVMGVSEGGIIRKLLVR